MNENINLCEILKGHEGETFYSVIHGSVKLERVQKCDKYPIIISCGLKKDSLTCNGLLTNLYPNGECVLFPSKDQRDWNKWIKEHKPKVPKTWNEIIVNKHSPALGVCLSPAHDGYYKNYHYETSHVNFPIEKSVLALLKIHQLIEVGYGGNVTKEEWNNHNTVKYSYCLFINDNGSIDLHVHPFSLALKTLIAFHTIEQAEEFLKYPENIQLLKDYYMI